MSGVAGRFKRAYLWVLKNTLNRLTLRAARGWPQPSDHVPVTVDLADR